MKMNDILEIPFGTRYVGFYNKGYGNQIPVTNQKEIKQVIDEHLGIDNLAISICTYKEGKAHLLFLPFDFDSENLEDAWEDAKKLYNHLILFNYGAYLIYSGRKGFHVLLAVKPDVYSKKQVKGIQKMFKNVLSLKTLDEQIFGDVRRLMRIPNTWNINGGLCKVLATYNGKEVNVGEIIEDKGINIPHDKQGEEKIYKDFPCIEHIIRDDNEPRHLIRFSYVILRLSEGWTYDEILDEMESFNWVDFDSEYSLKQIEHIDGRGYEPLSCQTLKDLGYCSLIRDCEHKRDVKEYLKDIGIL